MKKLILIFMFLFSLNLIYSEEFPIDENLLWFQVGYLDGVSLGGGGKMRGSDFGFEFGIIANADYSGADTYEDYEFDHDDFESLGRKTVSGELGLDVNYYLLDLSNNVHMYLGGGFYFQETAKLRKSNRTGLLYSRDNEFTIMPAASLGFQYMTPSHMFGLSFHTARGISFQFGFYLGMGY